MHDADEYENMITGRNLYFDRYMSDFIQRLEYARDNGCQTVILTGDTEPQQNWEFLKLFAIFNKMSKNPFKQVEMQTSGTLLDDGYLYFLRHHVGVTTIALSTANVFNQEKNFEIQQTPEKYQFDVDYLCSRIKTYRFTLRICLNMTNTYQTKAGYPHPEDYFNKVEELGGNQITFRKMYTSGNDTNQDHWIDSHQFEEGFFKEIATFIKTGGSLLRVLDYGQLCYSVKGMSTVVDDDCMSQIPKKDLKYLILRPDCKLYSQWDDKGSLIF